MIGAAVAVVVFAMLMGYFAGRAHADRIFKPCEDCGSAKYSRGTYGWAEAWICDDRDGCRARKS